MHSGQDVHIITQEDLKDMIPIREKDSHKGTYGYVALIGGSVRYSGAIRLAYMANAAMRSGAGVVKVALPKSLVHDVIPHILESTVFPLPDDAGELIYAEDELAELIKNVRTVAFGIGVSGETAKILTYLLNNYTGRLIIDADGLTILSGLDRQITADAGCEIVLTPHLGEFSRLSGKSIEKIQQAPTEAAVEYAKDMLKLRGPAEDRIDTPADTDRDIADEAPRTVLLLKGPATVITDGIRTYISETGCPGMATAGSGDVLSGILAATCAYIPNLTMAVAAGAYINGRAGELAEADMGPVSMTASDTVSHIPDVLKYTGKRPG